MENEFVPSVIALKMKELGFDNPCLGVFYQLVGDGWNRYFELDPRQSQYDAQKGWRNGILAPLYQQAFSWFEEKGLFTSFICTNTVTNDSWEFTIAEQNETLNKGFRQPITKREIENECLSRLVEYYNIKKNEQKE